MLWLGRRTSHLLHYIRGLDNVIGWLNCAHQQNWMGNARPFLAVGHNIFVVIFKIEKTIVYFDEKYKQLYLYAQMSYT